MSLGTKYNPKDVCNWCHKEQGRDNLRVCGGCRMVRYCSRDCQKGAWKTHKFSCSQNQQLVASLREDPVQESFNSLLTRWLTVWKPFLVMHGPIAYDMDPSRQANSPRNKMQTHCIFFDIESRPDERQVAKAFTMLRGGCIPKSEWADRLRADGNEDFADNFLADDRGQDTAILCFWATRHDDPASGLVRQLYFSMRDGGNTYRKRGKEESRKLAEGWADGVAFTIEQGNHTLLLKPSNSQLQKSSG